jgi:hypothetical protein
LIALLAVDLEKNFGQYLITLTPQAIPEENSAFHRSPAMMFLEQET